MRKLILLTGVIAIIFAGCKKHEIEVNPGKKDHPLDCPGGITDTTSGSAYVVNGNCAPVTSDFYAGQHALAGQVNVTNDDNMLYVTINTNNGWLLKHTHLYVGSLSNLPKSGSGNPKIGNFPFQTAHNPYLSSYTYSIPLADLGEDSCMVVSAHAEVKLIDENGNEERGETAWAAGNQLSNEGSWASYFDYCVCASSDSTNNGGDSNNDDSADDSEDDSNGDDFSNSF